MGRRTSIYLTATDMARIRAVGDPPLSELLRAGLAVLEAAGPGQAADDGPRRATPGPAKK